MALNARVTSALDLSVRQVKEGIHADWKGFSGTKAEFYWYERGIVSGMLWIVFGNTYHRSPSEDEAIELEEAMEEKFRDISDVISGFPDL